MASTPLAGRLTVAYRAEQLALQAGSIKDLVVLWRAVDVTNLSDTIDVFAHAAALLAGRGYDASAESAAAYITTFREAEIGTSIEARIAKRPTAGFLAGQIRGAAISGIVDARRAGKSIDYAGKQGLIRTIGSLGKLVLAGGRNTITGTVKADRQALGWQRATSGDPCTFCRMLAARGAVYKTERSAGFESHGHCSCTPEPLYSRDDPATKAAEESDEFKAEYDRAQAWARSSGTMSSSTSNDSLNNYRRWLASGKPTA